MKLNILAFGAHPDDVELGCSGAIAASVKKGMSAGIIDLTRGELGSRGNAEIRATEAEAAANILGCRIRENLGLDDGFFEHDKIARLLVIEAIRAYQPDIVFCNAMDDRHSDHGRGAELVEAASFLSGLIKIETFRNGELQAPWRPKLVLHYMQDRWIQPDIIFNITDVWDVRMESIKAHKSQFYDPASDEPATYISSKGFFDGIESRAREVGRFGQCLYAEGFSCKRPIGISDLSMLF